MTITVLPMPSVFDPRQPKSFFAEVDKLINWRECSFRTPDSLKGARIALEATISRDTAGEPYLANSFDSHKHGGRSHLHPKELDRSEKAALLLYCNAPVIALVTIQGRTAGTEDNTFPDYDVSSDISLIPLPINPSKKKLSAFPAGTAVVLEGIVEDVETCTKNCKFPAAYSHGRIHLQINGQTLVIAANCHCHYDTGVLDHIYKKVAMTGDRASLIAYTGEQGLHMYNLRPHLVVPGPARMAMYNALRHTVTDQIEELRILIEKCRYKTARRHFAHIYDKELTHEEFEKLFALIGRLPMDKQPIFREIGEDHIRKIEQIYGVNIAHLNRRRYLQFVRRILTETHDNPIKNVNHVAMILLYAMSEDPFTETDRPNVVAEMLDIHLPLLDQCEDEHDKYRGELDLVDEGLNQLEFSHGPSAFATLATVVAYCLDRGYFQREDEMDESQSCPKRFATLLTDAFGYIETVFEHNHLLGVQSESQVRDWQRRLTDGNADKETLDHFKTMIAFSQE